MAFVGFAGGWGGGAFAGGDCGCCGVGALSLEDAAAVVALRSRAIRAIAGGGGMASVPLPVGEVEGLLAGWGGELEVAAVNGPSSTVVSGPAGAVGGLVEWGEGAGVRVRRVPVDYASHSAQVEPLRAELSEVLGGFVRGRRGCRSIRRCRVGWWMVRRWMRGTGSAICGVGCGSRTRCGCWRGMGSRRLWRPVRIRC
ncbi:acyltransferase domain-containing protein [Peterkaempfera bronchialis]|uniref:Acyltransferase domain-containing protein n=1 Tax=Peterkaempfera bronchialis TaxID=2126346 RepID=A0A345T2L6_9ACTN|nr:acyltransferase domain-containing protein [Peterkaempfera bronchialis]